MIPDRVAAVRRLSCIQLLLAVCCLAVVIPAAAQQPAIRITQPIDSSKLVRLSGNIHPLARAEFDRGAAVDSQPLRRMILLLGRSPEQEKALQKLLEEQQSPGSANYRKWLSPAAFGQRFGVSDSDLQTITGWLATNGFEVTRLSRSKNFIEFNGTVGQLRQAFHTQIHKYLVSGKEHWANSSDPQIPTALAPVIKGFASLNNFPYKYNSHVSGNYYRNVVTGAVTPAFTTSGDDPLYALSPADFSIIYNSRPLLEAGYDGTGQTIAIVGETNLHPEDIASFRSVFGLGPGNTQIIIDGYDPGITDVGEETEAMLDIQWSSAVAPGATVKYVMSASTEVTQGVDLSALYIVENDLAGVMSESYSGCELFLGEAGNLFRLYLMEQAAAQGMTVVVSTGDNGSAACNYPSDSAATYGVGVNALGSTPFNVAVGGTDFDDAGNFATYWNPSNESITAGSYTLPYASAKGYIPERTWNDSCGIFAATGSLDTCVGKVPEIGGLTLWAGSGGRSSCAIRGGTMCVGHPKPSWQLSVTPNDGVRDLPDVSFLAAGGETNSRSLYAICNSDLLESGPACVPDNEGRMTFSAAGGTSAGAPSFAGVVALAMQKAGSRLGNINYLLYSVPQSSFQDVTTGTIAVPCVGGSPNCSAATAGPIGVLVDPTSDPAYATTAGYDLATGLGTPNIANLVDAVAMAANGRNSTTTTLTLNGGTAAITATHGSPITVAIDVANASGTGDGPEGNVALMSSTGIAIDGMGTAYPLVVGDSGHSAVSWPSQLLPGGTYDVYANYSGDDVNAPSRSGNIAVNVAPEDSKVIVVVETCMANIITGMYTGSITLSYGDCYFIRYDVTDAETGQFLGLVEPFVTGKCTNGTASCATGNLAITQDGAPLNTMALNPHGYTEDFSINVGGGTHTITASYPGDPSYNSSSGSITITINKASTSVAQPTSTPSSPAVGDSVKLVANVATNTNGVAPTGTVTFFDNGTAMTGTLKMTGKPSGATTWASALAVLTTSFDTTGVHTITAQYNGDDNYAASAVSVGATVRVSDAVPVAPAITAPTASVAPALLTVPVTLTTTVSPVSGSGATVAPTGTVTFLDNGTALAGTVNYSTSGTTLTATLSYTFTATGTHSITTQYSGDSRYTTATSSALSLNVAQPYSIALDQNSISRTGGGSGTVTLTLSPATGFTGNVNVSCASTSAEASCSVQSNPVSVPSGTNATDTITYTVPALSSALNPQQPFAPWKALNGMVLAGVFLLGIPGVRRRGRWMLTLVMLASAMLLVSCGGGSSTPPPPQPVTYTFTVNTSLAADSSVSSSTQFTVTVH